MRTPALLFTTCITLLATSSSTFAAECGDVNGDAKINISDLALILSHIASDAPISDTTVAELDGKIGITIGDLAAMTKNIFESAPLSCGASASYTYPPSMSDTIFIPVMMSVPDGVTDVYLPLLFSLDPSTYAVYLPIDPDPLPPESDFFDLHPFGLQTPGVGGGFVVASPHNASSLSQADTVTIQVLNVPHRNITPDDTLVTMHYVRTDSGVGMVGPSWFDRNNLLRIAVERNGELYTPVVIGNIIAVPLDSLLVSTDSLNFSFTSGHPARDTFVVDISSSARPLEFSITASEPWIILPNLPMTELITPFALEVTVDGSSIPIGSHTALIEIIPLDATVIVPVNKIVVDVTAFEPSLFQTGDVDCNGIVDIADLTILIDNLFINFTPLPVCQQ